MIRVSLGHRLRIMRLRVWLAMVTLVLLFALRTSTATALPSATTAVSDEVQHMVATAGAARVLILLDEANPAAITTEVQPLAVIAQRQRSVLDTLAPAEFQLYRQYQYIPGLAGTVTAAGLEKLRANPLVRAIQLDHPGSAHLQESLPALGGDIVHATYDILGRGVTVAVLDSGIDTDHPDLADAIVAQHCFTNRACPPNGVSESVSAEDENGHGSHVAGIITANGTVSGVGFAPAAQLVTVRVLDRFGGGYVSDWVAGLDWVRAGLATRPVHIVNMSLGTFALYLGSCDAQERLMATAVQQLHSQGVTIFASSGNQGSSSRIAAPACNSGVIAVGASYDGNVGRQPSTGTYQTFFGSSWPACADNTTTLQTITCFTNSNSQLDLLAPGAPILSTYINGKTATYWGTSQASPTAAGIAALLLEKQPNLQPDQLENVLKTSGSKVIDARNGLQIPEINALSALKAIIPIAPTGLTLRGPMHGAVDVAYPFTATLAPITATVPITYRWQVTGRSPITQSNGVTDTLILTWPVAGVYDIMVQAFNIGGMVSATQQITIETIAPTAVALTGPLTVSVGITHPFLATVQPFSATVPLTYVWTISDRPPLTRTSGITDGIPLVWTELGVYPMTVTVLDTLGIVSTTQAVAVQAIAPLTMTLTSTPTTTVGSAVTFMAQVFPLTTSLPITYLWQATDQPPFIHTGGLSDMMVYIWHTSGPVTVTVQAQNIGGAMVNQQTLFIVDERRLYLPLVYRP